MLLPHSCPMFSLHLDKGYLRVPQPPYSSTAHSYFLLSPLVHTQPPSQYGLPALFFTSLLRAQSMSPVLGGAAMLSAVRQRWLGPQQGRVKMLVMLPVRGLDLTLPVKSLNPCVDLFRRSLLLYMVLPLHKFFTLKKHPLKSRASNETWAWQSQAPSYLIQLCQLENNSVCPPKKVVSVPNPFL